jgi:hypothetical protein
MLAVRGTSLAIMQDVMSSPGQPAEQAVHNADAYASFADSL